MTCGLVWLREDLRVEDNTALTVARDENEKILSVYIINHAMWTAHDIAACRVEFILRNLTFLKANLKKKKIELLVIELNDGQHLNQVLNDLIHFYNVNALYFNEQYELNEIKRDAKVKASVEIPVYSFMDQCIFHPKAILTQSQTPYTIFTPYKRNFLQRLSNTSDSIPLKSINACIESLPEFISPSHWKNLGIILHTIIPNSLAGYHSSVPAEYWPGGEVAAHHRLAQFAQEKIYSYDKNRDIPSMKATSKLSPYLANGVLSPRQCFSTAIDVNDGRLINGEPGVVTWINELIWREFYKQIIANFPKVCMHRAFKKETETWPWQHDHVIFNAWTKAQTGYPLIDAAMRQLQSTGWMHNRLRMVVSMFLTKDCFIDWRWGEKFFMQHLIDGDLAANNGGWQWAASTGCDAVPYFRVFNPVRQSERFDPQGIFIKKYCPELENVPIKQLHNPFKLPSGLDYPRPIVDYQNTRDFLRNHLGKNLA